jgi:ubiquinone/menaquinone biosynthesis C-methylase UbiE
MSKEKKIIQNKSIEHEHFRIKAEAYGHSWWGQATEAGKQRLKRKQSILKDFLKRGNLQKNLLEVGCGAGELTSLVKDYLEVTGIDLTSDLIEIAKKQNISATYLCADLTQLPFENESFEAIVGDGILHHVDLNAAFLEIKRVLTKNGRILFFEPNMLNPQIFLERNIAFIRQLHQTPTETAFLKSQLEDFLKSNGWQDICVKNFDFLHPATPAKLINFVKKFGEFCEQMPIINNIAGSLWIEAVKGS